MSQRSDADSRRPSPRPDPNDPSSSGPKRTPKQQRLELTMRKVGTRWLAAKLVTFG